MKGLLVLLESIIKPGVLAIDPTRAALLFYRLLDNSCLLAGNG